MERRTERLLIWGAGGHGKVVADVARACGHVVVGFADASASKLGALAEPQGARVLCTEQELIAALGNGVSLPGEASAVVLAVGDNRARRRHLVPAARHLLPALVHPSAEVSPSVRMAPGTVVMPHAVVNAGVDIGAACIVNTGAIVEHDCVIGDAAHISSGAILLGGVRVGRESWIGARAVVRTLLSVGEGCMVGMGAVVIRDVADRTTVVGNPARELGARA